MFNVVGFVCNWLAKFILARAAPLTVFGPRINAHGERCSCIFVFPVDHAVLG